MLIPGDEIVSRDVIGTLGSKTVYQVFTAGGLYLIEARSSNGSKEVIGAGCHRAIARHIAKRNNPEIEFTMLEKNNVDIKDFEDILPFWEAVTKKAQNRLK